MKVFFVTNLDEAKQETWPIINFQPMVGYHVESTSGLRLMIRSVTIDTHGDLIAELHFPNPSPWKNILEFQEWYRNRRVSSCNGSMR